MKTAELKADVGATQPAVPRSLETHQIGMYRFGKSSLRGHCANVQNVTAQPAMCRIRIQSRVPE